MSVLSRFGPTDLGNQVVMLLGSKRIERLVPLSGVRHLSTVFFFRGSMSDHSLHGPASKLDGLSYRLRSGIDHYNDHSIIFRITKRDDWDRPTLSSYSDRIPSQKSAELTKSPEVLGRLKRVS